MKATTWFLLLAAAGTAASLGTFIINYNANRSPEPICNYIDEFGQCFETRIY